MALLKNIIQEIRKLSTAAQYRLKDYFTGSMTSYTASKMIVE
ncbi:hypothetical protein [Bacillus sp. DX4.1]|nr:hypothetical protein [Bacillus sp. DX4.1]